MEAIILAGGFGTRLRSVVSTVPKPMAPIEDKPFLVYILGKLNKQNVKKIIFAVGYKYEVIKDYFKDKYKDMEIVYSIEDEPLGTGGAIKKALKMTNSDNVFVLNGDTFFDIELKQLLSQHVRKDADITMALKPMRDFKRYGTVIVSNDRIISFEEKKYKKKGKINGGIYVINRKIFNKIKMMENFSFENDFVIKHIDHLKLYGFISDTYFIDIGIPKDYKKVQIELPTYIENQGD
ncbi:nucleotidyltransferase family protein [Lutibacter sp. B2]|nr:nucleotidyltransferase family protein [Lutibacter sp. B2]